MSNQETQLMQLEKELYELNDLMKYFYYLTQNKGVTIQTIEDEIIKVEETTKATYFAQ